MKNGWKQSYRSAARIPAALGSVFILTLIPGCSQLNRPKVESFYSATVPPPKQELRWTNGKLPVSLDPARALAAPEIDVVRAVYEGLTDIDPKTLREVPAAAESWESSADLKTWRFRLRPDARWTNGSKVTAGDFVRSWKRLPRMLEKSASRELLRNINGLVAVDSMITSPDPPIPPTEPTSPGADDLRSTRPAAVQNTNAAAANIGRSANSNGRSVPESGDIKNNKSRPNDTLGLVAIDDKTLEVKLAIPDSDLAKLVAHPIFRPVWGDGTAIEQNGLDVSMVTNGPFKISSIGPRGVRLVRSDNYWNKQTIALEALTFVSTGSTEAALEAYKNGEVDVVSNPNLEPLALKLLAPFEDFRVTAHNAVNLYEVNTVRAPFDDRRVRWALSLSIDRDRIAEADLEGTVQPAFGLSPLRPKNDMLVLDISRAKDLLDKAGYTDGEGFPEIRLLVNRNDTQQRVARSVARMWKQNLNLNCTIIVKETVDLEASRQSGDYDLIRRGVVLPANDHIVNLAMIFGWEAVRQPLPIQDNALAATPNLRASPATDSVALEPPSREGERASSGQAFTEEEALFQMRAIPLYFPTSYSLIKPYVGGYDINGLDAPSVQTLNIDSKWQSKSPTE